MTGADAALTDFGYAFTLTGTAAMTLTFIYLAAERKPLGFFDRAMCVAHAASLTALAVAALFAHHYGRALIIALMLAMLGASARAAIARAPHVHHVVRAPGAERASPHGRRWRRTRRPRPYH